MPLPKIFFLNIKNLCWKVEFVKSLIWITTEKIHKFEWLKHGYTGYLTEREFDRQTIILSTNWDDRSFTMEKMYRYFMENRCWIFKLLIMLNASLKLWNVSEKKKFWKCSHYLWPPFILGISTALLNFRVIMQNNILILKCCSC